MRMLIPYKGISRAAARFLRLDCQGLFSLELENELDTKRTVL
jgi:hypothetical protein